MPQSPELYVLALVFNNKNELLLIHRKNTKWFSNCYGLVGGKVEENESVAKALKREVFEEIGINFSSEGTEFAHIMHFNGTNTACIAFFFIIRSWEGKMLNKETAKHSSLDWFSVNGLPDAIIPRHLKAIENIKKGSRYSEDNW